MSHDVTLSAGRARVLVLLAIAMLLASLATMTTMLVAPRHVLAGDPPNCNSIMNPDNPEGITVTIVSVGGGTPAFYYDAADGLWYDNSSGIAGAGSIGANPDLVFRVTYGRLAQSDVDKDNAPWCIYYQGNGGNNKDWIAKGSLPASDSLSSVYQKTVQLNATDYAVGQTICIGARVPARTGENPGNAPKDHDCFTVRAHNTTTTPDTASLALRVTTSPASNANFRVNWTCTVGSGSPTLVGNAAATTVATGLTIGATCEATPASGPDATWKAGGKQTIVSLAKGLNTITVTFEQGSKSNDPGCSATNSCDEEVLGIVTKKPATAPPTDGLAASTGSTVPALGVLLLILAAILATVGWFTPATKRIRR